LRNYEIMLIFDASLEEDAIEKELKKVTSIIEKGKGSVADSQKWGVRRLAYPIKHQENGYYHLINFSSTDVVVNEIDRVNKINDKLLRYLIVKEEKNSKE
jgi:small subunit ribosomal protein S6